MCILVGGAGVGKTSLARTAAQLAGRQLTEIALTGGTDTADLLGGFEQLEPKRKVQVSDCCCDGLTVLLEQELHIVYCVIHQVISCCGVKCVVVKYITVVFHNIVYYVTVVMGRKKSCICFVSSR